MRSRVQVSLPLPTKNQALASTQVLFFYPFPDSSPNSHPLCSALQRHRFIAFHRPTCKKNSKKSAVRLSPAPLREPLEGAFGGSLFGPSAGVFGGASAGTLGGACSKPMLGTFWRAFGAPLRELLEESLFEAFWRVFGEPLRAPLRAQQKTRPRRTGSTHKH